MSPLTGVLFIIAGVIGVFWVLRRRGRVGRGHQG
jgi:hypothetical protein